LGWQFRSDRTPWQLLGWQFRSDRTAFRTTSHPLPLDYFRGKVGEVGGSFFFWGELKSGSVLPYTHDGVLGLWNRNPSGENKLLDPLGIFSQRLHVPSTRYWEPMAMGAGLFEAE